MRRGTDSSWESNLSFTILFDLDDTLIRNEMGVFLPAYFQLLQQHMAGLLPAERMMPFFMNATQQMLMNDSPDKTLADVFFENFLRDVQLPLESVLPAFDSLYAARFPELRRLTEVIPAAQDAVGMFSARSYRLVVATNPLFPQTAQAQRVAWAELPLNPEGFEVITSIEFLHFAKPNPAYFAETLAYLGWPTGPILMVGNDAANDVRGAAELGLATFQVVGTDPLYTPDGLSPLHGSGALSDLAAWIDEQNPADMVPVYRSRPAVQAILKSTAAALQSFVHAGDPSGWSRRIGAEWTPHETLFHLVEVEQQVNLPRLQAMRRDRNPFLSAVDTDAWRADGFPELGHLEETFRDFLSLRLETLALLAELGEEGWQLPARHAIFGPTDLLEVASIIAGHDQLHIRQIQAQLRPPVADLVSNASKTFRTG